MRIYREIERDFSFPREREIEARDFLSGILGNDFIPVEKIAEIIGDEVYVVGFGPNLEREAKHMEENYPIIAADDAAVVLHNMGIEPDIVMTDLDGNVQSLLEIPAIFGIHAHGDNMDRLPLASKFTKRFGTTQIEPAWNVYNFGGFTDGDRAVFMAAHFGARIHLVGFDFENPRIKEGKDPERKRKKLAWARKLIAILEAEGAEIIWENLK